MGTEAPMSASGLLREAGVPHEANAPVGELTWYAAGGRAEALAHPRTVEELGRLTAHAHEVGVPVRILGRGANLLVADEGVTGVVVRLDSPPLRQIDVDGDTVTAGGGTDLARLIMTCVRCGRGGLEGLAGIPASVGGAVRMNAGGAFGEIGGRLRSVDLMGVDGGVRRVPRQALTLGYRRSTLPDPFVVRAHFALDADDPATLRTRVKEVFGYKKKSQPLADKSAGCAFKNPPSGPGAGELIDEAGLKGRRVGGAEVSPLHGNFIVLHRGGHASDVVRLIQEVERTVADRFDVTLEREVIVWGEKGAA